MGTVFKLGAAMITSWVLTGVMVIVQDWDPVYPSLVILCQGVVIGLVITTIYSEFRRE